MKPNEWILRVARKARCRERTSGRKVITRQSHWLWYRMASHSSLYKRLMGSALRGSTECHVSNELQLWKPLKMLIELRQSMGRDVIPKIQRVSYQLLNPSNKCQHQKWCLRLQSRQKDLSRSMRHDNALVSISRSINRQRESLTRKAQALLDLNSLSNKCKAKDQAHRLDSTITKVPLALPCPAQLLTKSQPLLLVHLRQVRSVSLPIWYLIRIQSLIKLTSSKLPPRATCCPPIKQQPQISRKMPTVKLMNSLLRSRGSPVELSTRSPHTSWLWLRIRQWCSSLEGRREALRSPLWWRA